VILALEPQPLWLWLDIVVRHGWITIGDKSPLHSKPSLPEVNECNRLITPNEKLCDSSRTELGNAERLPPANIVSRHGYRCFSPFARLLAAIDRKFYTGMAIVMLFTALVGFSRDILSRPDLRACENHHWARSERNGAPAGAFRHPCSPENNGMARYRGHDVRLYWCVCYVQVSCSQTSDDGMPHLPAFVAG
jgi:hypothetical protein